MNRFRKSAGHAEPVVDGPCRRAATGGGGLASPGTRRGQPRSWRRLRTLEDSVTSPPAATSSGRPARETRTDAHRPFDPPAPQGPRPPHRMLTVDAGRWAGRIRSGAHARWSVGAPGPRHGVRLVPKSGRPARRARRRAPCAGRHLGMGRHDLARDPLGGRPGAGTARLGVRPHATGGGRPWGRSRIAHARVALRRCGVGARLCCRLAAEAQQR